MPDNEDGLRSRQAKPWVLNIIPVPYPGLSDAPEAYRLAWQAFVDANLKVTPDADREHWLEQAARLEAGIRLLGEDVIVRIYGRTPIRLDGTPVDKDKLQGLPHYGIVLDAPPSDYLDCPGNANLYAMSDTVRSLMRRRTILTRVDSTELEQAVRELDKDNPRGVTLKYVRREKTLPLARLDHGQPFDAAAWLDWEEVRFEGDPYGVLVQDTVRMEYEYRVFVIDHTPACGAACIESHTPADNTGDPFDDRMQQRRNRTPVKCEPELAARLVGFARRAANLIRHEGFVTPTYVMDVAFIDGQPGIIELNNISNAGLYALDMTTLLTAVREHPEQFTPATPLATQEENR